ncbi:WecB/TagA/CpsF family glycosyltransferase [Clostridium sp.]|uniref:WecB/TagA/CpsF family glycosyltransferase n=1 Tax=Clostridium sp. TaxID=1506 RepID=UPI0034643D06
MKKDRVQLLNIYVDNVDMKEAIDRVEELATTDGYHYVVTPNVAHLVSLEEDLEFRQVYDNADLILTDGMPLIWISNWFKKPIKEKVSGSDLFPLMCERAANKGYKVFLLGAAEGVATLAAEKLKNKYSNLQVVGTYSPPYGFEKNPREIQKVLDIVNEAKPHILFVGLGAPKQEKFIFRYKDELKVPVSLGIGASIDFEAGNIKRAPRWMQKSGLEGFYRFFKEPRRMFKRVFIDDFKIVKLIFKYKKHMK